jgi:iron complex transport system substrate-binding protein
MIAAARRCWLPLLVAACSRTTGPGPGTALEFDDAEGHAVTLPRLPAQRIVSTMQSATEWLVLLGAGDRLIARTDYDHEAGLARLPSIGGGLDPSPEAVAALKPDVVLGWRNRSSADLEHALASFHIPVLSFETTDTADLFRNLQRLGILVAREQRAESLAAGLRAKLREVQRTACDTAATAPPTVLLVLWTDPPMTAGGGTWMTTMLDAACLRNVFGDLHAAWPTVSMEAIAARRPDWILTSRGAPGQRLVEFRSKPGWRDLDAVRAGRIIEIPGDLFARAGPTIADAAAAIVAARRAIEQH